MAITVTVEDGTGKSNANSYAAVADADSYHESNLHTSALWAALTATQKAQAVVTATRILDQQVQWNGVRSNPSVQALQWPRLYCPNPDAPPAGAYSPTSEDKYLDSASVPKDVKNACMELACSVAQTNFEAAPSGEGLASFALDGVMSVQFDLSTKPDLMPKWVVTALRNLGTFAGGKSSTVKLVRA